eukprot:NODE_352_length_10276_cov_0.244178.p8 type:complete len:100 gc:universal NODE_352_length_10276_cov_0.244178:2822-3121(+)
MYAFRKYKQSFESLIAQHISGQHALNSNLNYSDFLHIFVQRTFKATRPPRMSVIHLLNLFSSGNINMISIYNDAVITKIFIGRIILFSFTLQSARYLCR